MQKTKRHQTNLISVIIIVVTIALLVLLSICLAKQQSLEVRFDAVISWLSRLDNAIAGLDSQVEILICIAALYIAKCQLPIPMSVLAIIAGMVFSLPMAVLINLVLTAFFFTVKYYEGVYLGGGWAMMILNKRRAKFLKQWITFKGTGNPYILVVTRLTPIVPLGIVSKLYGSMRYDFAKYMFLSILGYLPRLFIYTGIGTALYNPFSRTFIILVMVIVGLSGITSFAFNIYYGIKSNQMTQSLLIYSQKEKYRIVL